jgi:membrane protease YdiL (CAAX protease family)
MLFYSSNLYASLKKLYFNKINIGYSIVIGSFSAILTLFFIGLIFYLLIQIGYMPPNNPLGERIAEKLTLPLVFIISFLSSVSEEIFFRGFLQPKLIRLTTPLFGIVITSALFGFAHIAYHNPLQIVIPFCIGIIFGFLLLKTKNIIAPISAHFFFNFIQLALAYFSL